MMQQKLLTSDELATIMSPSLEDQSVVDVLIAMLEKKSNDAFSRFYKALKSESSHLGHNHLVKIIDEYCSMVL